MSLSLGISLLGLGATFFFPFAQMLGLVLPRWVQVLGATFGFLLMLVWPLSHGILWLQDILGPQRRPAAFFLVLATGAVLGMSIAGGTWWLTKQEPREPAPPEPTPKAATTSPAPPKPTMLPTPVKLSGPVKWDFTNVLSTSGVHLGQRSFRVLGFIFQGTSATAIKSVSGYVRSNINAEERTVYISTHDGLARPDQIRGVPPGARVEIVAPFIPVVGTGLVDDPTKSLDEPTFLERFGDFTFVVELDGKREEHHFSRDDVDRFLVHSKRLLYGPPQPRIETDR